MKYQIRDVNDDHVLCGTFDTKYAAIEAAVHHVSSIVTEFMVEALDEGIEETESFEVVLTRREGYVMVFCAALDMELHVEPAVMVTRDELVP